MKRRNRRISPAYIALAVLIALVAAFNVFAFINTREERNAEEAAAEGTGFMEEASEEPSQEPEQSSPEPEGPSQEPAEESPPAEPEDSSPEKITETPVVRSIVTLNPELSAKLDSLASINNCAAVSLAVFDGESVFYTYQYGYADAAAQRTVREDTKFRVASLSKLAAAVCVMNLVDAGKIDLDADISKYLGYQVRNPAYPSTPVTCRMLLTHTSSLCDSEEFSVSRGGNSTRSTKELLEGGSVFRKRRPGTKHEYTNFGFAVLGDVCEKVSGKLIDTLARDVLFDPLGIDAAYTPMDLRDTDSIAVIYDEGHNISRSVQSQLDIGSSDELGRDHHLTQGNLTISALDYAKVLAMLANNGELDGRRILSEESAREIQDAKVHTDVYEQGLAVRYQENAFLGGDVYWHTGSAYGELTQFIYDAEEKYGVVVITTGAKNVRLSNGMVTVCNDMTEAVWPLKEGVDTQPLRGMVICLDPGHQGRGDRSLEKIAPGAEETKHKVASGTTGVFTKIPEYVLTLEVGLALRDKLEALGAEVVMTRMEHNVNISNSERAELANLNNCDMTIRIHADGAESSSVRGYSILVPGSVYTPGIVPDSTRMAVLLDEAMKDSVPIPSRGIITRDDLTGFNWLTVPGILIEMGYMTNETDDAIMQTAEYKEALINAVAKALLLYRS